MPIELKTVRKDFRLGNIAIVVEHDGEFGWTAYFTTNTEWAKTNAQAIEKLKEELQRVLDMLKKEEND